MIKNIFAGAKFEQQVYQRTISILKLKDKYSKRLLETAAEYILSNHITPYTKNFKLVLLNLQDEVNTKDNNDSSNDHTVIRGASYYGGLIKK